MPLRNRKHGFTLIELMVAVSIAALLIAVGIPSFITFMRNSEVRSTAESMVNGLRVARTEALSQNRWVAFTVVGGGPSWAINRVDQSTNPPTLISPPIQQYAMLEAGINTTMAIRSAVTGQPSATAVSVVFNGLGRVISPSPLATDNFGQIDISSAVTNQARSLRIYVDYLDPATGKLYGIRMCDPDPLLLAAGDARAC